MSLFDLVHSNQILCLTWSIVLTNRNCYLSSYSVIIQFLGAFSSKTVFVLVDQKISGWSRRLQENSGIFVSMVYILLRCRYNFKQRVYNNKYSFNNIKYLAVIRKKIMYLQYNYDNNRELREYNMFLKVPLKFYLT